MGRRYKLMHVASIDAWKVGLALPRYFGEGRGHRKRGRRARSLGDPSWAGVSKISLSGRRLLHTRRRKVGR